MNNIPFRHLQNLDILRCHLYLTMIALKESNIDTFETKIEMTRNAFVKIKRLLTNLNLNQWRISAQGAPRDDFLIRGTTQKTQLLLTQNAISNCYATIIKLKDFILVYVKPAKRPLVPGTSRRD